MMTHLGPRADPACVNFPTVPRLTARRALLLVVLPFSIQVLSLSPYPGGWQRRGSRGSKFALRAKPSRGGRLPRLALERRGELVRDLALNAHVVDDVARAVPQRRHEELVVERAAVDAVVQ